MNRAVAFGEVFVVNPLDAGEMFFERVNQTGWENREAVVAAFGVADNDLAVFKINVFDAQLDTFHEAQSAAVEYLRHEFVRTCHFRYDALCFGAAQYYGDTSRFFSAGDLHFVEFDLKNITIQK